jgi:uncharacterized membrane protein YhiD involved in acid resistance
MPMENPDLWLVYRDLAIALAAGLLIGVERGWTLRDEHKGARVAGIRTFGLIAGTGGLIALIAQSLNLIMAAILLAGVVTMLSVSYARTIQEPDGRSITNFVVSLLTLCLGLLAGSGYPALAMAGAAIVTALLSMRSETNGGRCRDGTYGQAHWQRYRYWRSSNFPNPQDFHK